MPERPSVVPESAAQRAGTRSDGPRDRILLNGLAFYAHHGVGEREQELGQVFTVDLSVETDLHRAGHTDALADTIDYRNLYERVREAVTGTRYHLLEAVAEAIAHALLGVERVQTVTVRVSKPHVRLGGPLESAAVEVTRRRMAGREES